MSGTKVSTPGTCSTLLLLLSSFFSTRHFADAACSPVFACQSDECPKKTPTQKSRNDHMTRVCRGHGCACSDGNQVCSIKSGGQRLQSEVKVITFLYFQFSQPLRCITKRVGTTSTQWKQTASSTDVITRISPVSPSLPLLSLPSDPLIRPMGARGSGRGEAGWDRVRQAPSFPAVLQQTQIRSHGRGAGDSPVCILALKEKSQDDQASVSACKETSRGRSDQTFCPPFLIVLYDWQHAPTWTYWWCIEIQN